ncbi:DUF1120 domain-containing protein [Stenotrophomonas sp.]|uniref:DUF1120 domain-containing protein n=1 Tax=Stenotrophomonas sp. TaxID=69392 RepID=UPI0028A637E6|nr:DUF1120 domain-containing protein [Stenotrophomonas sp.]
MNRTRLALATLLIASAPAAFANTAQINVTGTITPAACQITLANGGNFDLGEINAADLNATSYTQVPEQETDIAIDCTGATRFAISAVDHNEADNQEGGIARMSLGKTTAGEAIGYFYTSMKSPMSAANALYGTYSDDGGQTWSASASSGPYITSFARGGRLVGLTTASGSTAGPAAIQQLTGKLGLRAVINQANELTLADDQAINGGVTLTVEFI